MFPFASLWIEIDVIDEIVLLFTVNSPAVKLEGAVPLA